MKKIVDRDACQSLLSLVNMGKVVVIKEHDEAGPVYIVRSASGAPIGIVGKRYEYMFEAALVRQGSGDGLLDGCSQTTR